MNYFFLDKKKYRGFSLIELVVVVGVLAVLSAIAIPSFICFPKRAKATAALAALRKIKTECALKEAEAKPEIFTSSSLDGYTIQTSGSNSCDGSNGVISAVPDNTNELPIFNLAAATGSLTYKFKGMEGTNLSGCLGLICGDGDRLANLPPNESKLFGSDSGLSCREVISNNLGRFDYSIGWTGSGVKNDGDKVKLTLQPVTLSVGDKDWLVDNVQTEITYYDDPSKIGKEWMEPFFKKAIELINDSEGEFSAEIDPNNPQSINIYSSSGNQIQEVNISTDMTVNGAGSIPIDNVAFNEKKPWAMIALSNWHGRSEDKKVNQSSVSTTNNNGSILGQKLTTICDGKD